MRANANMLSYPRKHVGIRQIRINHLTCVFLMCILTHAFLNRSITATKNAKLPRVLLDIKSYLCSSVLEEEGEIKTYYPLLTSWKVCILVFDCFFCCFLQIRDELCKETLQLASKLQVLFFEIFKVV